ncbi:hypothetical protein FK545_12895 [Planococcus glaciei]|nr:hypothetical protein [Planococcus glaciei]QDY46007.1 hypothetical protein FK545_12895 [Planococcus glaciei]
MLEGVTIVMGFMVVIFLFFFTLLHFLGKELHAHDAEHVDPLPKKDIKKNRSRLENGFLMGKFSTRFCSRKSTFC